MDVLITGGLAVGNDEEVTALVAPEPVADEVLRFLHRAGLPRRRRLS